MAKQFGADILHDPNDAPLSEVIADVTDNGRGFDVTAEAVGNPNSSPPALTPQSPAAKPTMIGVSPEGSPLPVDLYDMHFREIKLVGAFRQGDGHPPRPKRTRQTQPPETSSPAATPSTNSPTR